MHSKIPFFIYKWIVALLIIILIINLFIEFEWFSVILLILILTSIIIYSSFKFYNKRKSRKNRQQLESFKLNSRKIIVDLTQFKIKSNSWVDTVITDKSEYAGLNQLTGNSEKNFTKVNRQIHHIEIPIKINNENFNYIFKSSRDLNSLKIDLFEKKNTTLYINPADESDYYLDMEFLSNY